MGFNRILIDAPLEGRRAFISPTRTGVPAAEIPPPGEVPSRATLGPVPGFQRNLINFNKILMYFNKILNGF